MMDCRNFKELLDSYLSGELLVETNHAVLRHMEHCSACRAEAAARREVRDLLRSACAKETMSAAAEERLRERLRIEGVERESLSARFSSIFSHFPTMRLQLIGAVVILLAIVGGLYGLTHLRSPAAYAAELSPALINQAAGDHEHCAIKFADLERPEEMDEAVKKYDPAYADLDKIAETGAQGMELHAAHMCDFGGRNFAHLVYTRKGQLISLLVTERNNSALRNGVVPLDNGLQAGLQHALADQYQVSAFQTVRHIVLVISSLPELENRALAERVAAPISQRLRRIEGDISQR